eukprot:scaffold743_cov177-Ochromonas_danica.AAC.15
MKLKQVSLIPPNTSSATATDEDSSSVRVGIHHQTKPLSSSTPTKADAFEMSFLYQLPIRSVQGEEVLPEKVIQQSSPSQSNGWQVRKSSYCTQLLAKRDQIDYLNHIYRDGGISIRSSFPTSFYRPSRAGTSNGRSVLHTRSNRQPVPPPTAASLVVPSIAYQSSVSNSDKVVKDSSEKVSSPKDLGNPLPEEFNENYDYSSEWQRIEVERKDPIRRSILLLEGLKIEGDGSFNNTVGRSSSSDKTESGKKEIVAIPGSPTVKEAVADLTEKLLVINPISPAPSPSSVRRKRSIAMPSLSPLFGSSFIRPGIYLGSASDESANSCRQNTPVRNAIALGECLQVLAVGAEKDNKAAVVGIDASSTTTDGSVVLSAEKPAMIVIPTVKPKEIFNAGSEEETTTTPMAVDQRVLSLHSDEGQCEVFMGHLLGCGAFSRVYKGRYMTKSSSTQSDASSNQWKDVAVKVPLANNEWTRNNFMRELLVFQHLSSLKASMHDNDPGGDSSLCEDGDHYLLELLATFRQDSNSSMCLVFPRYSGINLKQWLDRNNYQCGVDFPFLIGVLQQLLLAVAFLHEEAQVIHADIKPDNILLKHLVEPRKEMDQEFELVLIDFGNSIFFYEADAANSLKDKASQGVVQSPSYRAPEVMDHTYYGR